jgi:hypothetical protein
VVLQIVAVVARLYVGGQSHENNGRRSTHRAQACGPASSIVSNFNSTPIAPGPVHLVQ